MGFIPFRLLTNGVVMENFFRFMKKTRADF